VQDRVKSTREPTARPERARILVVSPWETVWSLGRDQDVAAGVSDDDRFIDGFTHAGYQVHFLRPRSAKRDPRVVTHFYPNFFRLTRWLPTPFKRPLWPLLFDVLVAPRALALTKSLGAGLVLGHSHYSTFATWLCARRLGVRSAVKLFGVMDLVHTEWPPLKYWFKNVEQLLALEFPQDAWIVLDDGTRGDRILRGRGIPWDRIHFLPNGLNLEWMDATIDRATAREKFGLPQDSAVVLFLARLVESKRPLDFLHAAAHMETPARFVFAGDGGQRHACEQAARELGMAERTHFLGTVAHDDVPALMATADVFVSTSTLTNRALPTCEAMICGVPVVVYDTGDTTTVVRDEDTGLVVKDGDIEALAAAIDRLLGDPQRRARLAEGGRRMAKEKFVSWERRIQEEMGIIDELTRRSG
jgi:L-malate glycosyltransferase